MIYRAILNDGEKTTMRPLVSERPIFEVFNEQFPVVFWENFYVVNKDFKNAVIIIADKTTNKKFNVHMEDYEGNKIYPVVE